MAKSIPAIAFVSISIVLLAAHPVRAQGLGRVELSGGFLNVMGTMNGATAQVAAPLTPHWSLVGEADFSRGPDPGDDTYIYRDVALLGGVRYAWHAHSRILPFAQVLAGGLHSTARGDVCLIFSSCYAEAYTINYFAVQPGGGVTFMLSPRVGIRTQADFQLAIPNQSEWEGFSLFPRVAVSAVVGLGARR